MQPLLKCRNEKKETNHRPGKGFNDGEEDVLELKKVLTNKLFHLNLINLNLTNSCLEPSKNMEGFVKMLEKYNLAYTIRRSLGSEIKAACGQLAAK